ncbi:hypothetical protein [Gemmobacter sp. 24YEA27]|uniref:hypothetical protein n=1 Tax=Gemmobacter sp. 24YEA27 TaxID=3040672 RepID=UPI0024B37534|nr:hypothetical protein [Gemmobacter sp. 24YEA27]
MRRIKPAHFLPGKGKTTRITLPGEACLSFVTTMESDIVSPRLRALMTAELPGQGMVPGFFLSCPARHLPERSFDGLTSAAALFRKESECLALIGQVFDERAVRPGHARSPAARPPRGDTLPGSFSPNASATAM